MIAQEDIIIVKVVILPGPLYTQCILCGHGNMAAIACGQHRRIEKNIFDLEENCFVI